MANQISVNTGSGAGAQQVIVDSNGNITVTVSRSVIGTVANVASANYANFAGNVVNAAQPNITSVGNLTNLNVTNTTTTGNLVVTGNLSVGNLIANSANYANFAGVAYSVAGANVSGAVANATFATTAGTANTANSATVANSANAVAGANVSGTVANATFATTAGSANTANSATIAASANSVTLANVSGAGNIASINLDGSTSNVLYGNGIFAPVATGNVANANYANFAGNAFSVDGGNVVGAVANATFALDAGNANIANIAYSVDGANVSGAVANATFALDAGNANIANIAYNVDAANVSGLGNIATINLDGNASNLLDGTGNFVAIPTSTANANYANFAGNAFSVDGGNVVGAVANATYAANAAFADDATFANYVGFAVNNTSATSHLVSFVAPGFTANKQILVNDNFIFNPLSETLQVQNLDGTVVKAAQPNITSTGNLVSLTINNAVGNTVTSQFNPNLITVPTTFQFPNAVSVIKTSGVTGALNTVQPFYTIKDRPGNAAASSNDFIVRNVFGATSSSGNVAVASDFFNQVRGTPGAANAWAPGSFSWRNGLTNGNLTPSSTFTTGFISMSQLGTFSISAGAPGSSGITLATFGTQNGTISNTASANAFIVSRGRGNGDSRLTVEPNDYLGDIAWNGTVANGTSGTQTAKIRARIDSAYVANTTNMPIGFEVQTVGNAGALNTHNFYANGNVLLSNSLNANIITANYFYGDGSNISNISAGTPNSIQNGNSIVDFTGVDGDLRISTNNVTNGVQISGRDLTLNGVGEQPPANSVYSQLNVRNGGLSLSQDNIGGGLATFAFTMYEDTNSFLNPYTFYRARGNATSPTAVANGDTIISQQYYCYADSGNTYSSLGSYNVTVNTNDGAGNVSSSIAIVSTNNDDGSTISLVTDIINLDGNVSTPNNINVNSGNVIIGADGSIDYNRVFGCFHKVANVVAANANTIYNFNWFTDTTVHVGNEGVTVTSADPTYINIDTAGSYEVFLEMHGVNTDNQDRPAYVWLAKNGTDISETCIKFVLQKETDTMLVKEWLVDNISANDYLEVRFAVDNISGISLEYIASQSSPYARPAVPSATITVTPVGA